MQLPSLVRHYFWLPTDHFTIFLTFCSFTLAIPAPLSTLPPTHTLDPDHTHRTSSSSGSPNLSQNNGLSSTHQNNTDNALGLYGLLCTPNPDWRTPSWNVMSTAACGSAVLELNFEEVLGYPDVLQQVSRPSCLEFKTSVRQMNKHTP